LEGEGYGFGVTSFRFLVLDGDKSTGKMSKFEELSEALTTLKIEIKATRDQHERARVACDTAVVKGDKEGVRIHAARLEDCDNHLKELRERLASVEALWHEAWQEIIEELSVEELVRMIESFKKKLETLKK